MSQNFSPTCRPAHLPTCRSFWLGRSLALPKGIFRIHSHAECALPLSRLIAALTEGWRERRVAHPCWSGYQPRPRWLSATTKVPQRPKPIPRLSKHTPWAEYVREKTFWEGEVSAEPKFSAIRQVGGIGSPEVRPPVGLTFRILSRLSEGGRKIVGWKGGGWVVSSLLQREAITGCGREGQHGVKVVRWSAWDDSVP